MIALCYYERIENPDLDGKFNVLALQNFQELINYFPDSTYTKDSKQKIILIKENIAAKHMNVGLFYLNRKNYLAALKRYQKVIDDHFQSKYTPEALHRLVEIYSSIGMIEEAKKTASVLGYNYPKSKWYKHSYNLVEEKNFNKSKKNNLFKKILNKISSNNEK
jgi:outer membrane protein assembly factor BamD